MTGVSQRAHLDATAFIAALNALTPAELLRLSKKSALHAPGTGTGGDDLLQEAIRRTLEPDGRKCPADVPVTVYLDNAMRSIADGERVKYAREAPAAGEKSDRSAAGATTDYSHSAEATVVVQDELERTVEGLEAMFADDPQALAVLIGDMEGWSAQEIKKAESIDDTQYATARRRVRRAIERKFGGGHQS